MSRAGSRSLVSPHRLDVPGSDPLAARLFPPLPREAEWELVRVERLLSEAGDPHLAYPSLHVGGTNGKGSVAALLASVLGRRGLRVGLYTSPHLISFRERYSVDGRPAAAADLLAAAASLRAGIVSHGLTFFEAATVLAFELFRREGVEVAVVEVGLGGRLDATNVLRPEVASVTNVARDHAEYLGSELVEIAREKGGIAKPGVPFVTTETDPRILEVLRSVALERGAEFHAVDPARELEGVETGPGGTTFEAPTGGWGRLRVRLPLAGRHQAVNGLLALRVLELAGPRLRPEADELLEGLSAVRWPGRFQVERARGRTWVLDVAHNPAGVRTLAGALHELGPPRPRAVLVGILGDKEWKEMLPPLFSDADAAILTQPPAAPEHRRWDPGAALAEVEPPPRVEIVPDFVSALERAVEESAPGGTVVVTGSHYTVGAALRALGRAPHPSP